MAFVVRRNIKGKDYYYLRKSVREKNKIISKHIAYLGADKSEAYKKAGEIIKKMGKGEKNKDALTGEKSLSVEEMASFCKRKGFVYPSAEIYGGLAGFWDFGHIGVELKNNIKNEWWNFFVRQREDVVGIDGSIITNPKVWKSSGHVDSFSDILVVCKKCKKTDKIDKHEIRKVKCPNCGGEIDWEKIREIEQMFRTNVGTDGFAYLRPETAQLIFTNFKFVYENSRMKLPFGIAQIGKSFRNEIAPRDFLFRLREFEQMEIEYFIDTESGFPYELGKSKIFVYSEEMQKSKKEPEKMSFNEAHKRGIIKTDWHAYWLEQMFLWFKNLGANTDKFRVRQHVSDEKSHYAVDTWDLEYNFPFGWKELQGVANRGDYDLKQHQKYSGKSMEISNSEGKKIIPHVVAEPSQGVERAYLVFLFDAYNYNNKRDNVVLKLHPKLAPIKVAIFPIVKNNEDFVKLAREVYGDLKKDWNVVYDESGSIGRRYARNDEIGAPYCITIDGDSIKDKDVTIRDRDTTRQIRVKVSDLKDVLSKLINSKIKFEDAGKVVK